MVAGVVDATTSSTRSTESLPEAFSRFRKHASPRVMALVAAGAVVTRVLVGGWSDGDLIALLSVLALDPFVEWVFHVGGLHLRPHTVRGVTIDPLFARRHRLHHNDPRDEFLIFVPLPVLSGLLAVVIAVGLVLIPSRAIGLTVVATAVTVLLAYEWVHFLIHSRYVPRSRLYRIVWRSHTLHHYKNEKYWFGVTNPVADLVLRTYPRREEVATSPTARTLGVLAGD